MAVDLNALRDRVHQIERERETGGGSTTEQSNPVLVDREGGIHLNAPSDREVSRVPIDKFAASRIERDRATARSKLPRNTREVRSPDYGPDGTAWLYELETSFGIRFRLFAMFDGVSYQVQVVDPEIEQQFRNPHVGHLWKDARICFGNGPNSGMPSLESAFAKSALWAEGICVVRAGGEFPFNFDQ